MIKKFNPIACRWLLGGLTAIAALTMGAGEARAGKNVSAFLIKDASCSAWTATLGRLSSGTIVCEAWTQGATETDPGGCPSNAAEATVALTTNNPNWTQGLLASAHISAWGYSNDVEYTGAGACNGAHAYGGTFTE